MSDITISVTGADEIGKWFDRVPDEMFARAGQTGMRRALRPVLASAKSIVRKRSHALEKSLIIKVKTYKKTLTVAGIVGPQSNLEFMFKGKVVHPAYMAHLIEYGHILKTGKGRTTKKGYKAFKSPKQTIGVVPPFPFMRPAFDQNMSRIEESLGQCLDDALEAASK